MSHVAPLIASRDLPELAGLAARAADALGGGVPLWLAPGTAGDIPLVPAGGSEDRITAEHVRDIIGDMPVDVAVQPAAGRRKRLLLADMDSTMIGQECL